MKDDGDIARRKAVGCCKTSMMGRQGNARREAGCLQDRCNERIGHKVKNGGVARWEAVKSCKTSVVGRWMVGGLQDGCSGRDINKGGNCKMGCSKILQNEHGGWMGDRIARQVGSCKMSMVGRWMIGLQDGWDLAKQAWWADG